MSEHPSNPSELAAPSSKCDKPFFPWVLVKALCSARLFFFPHGSSFSTQWQPTPATLRVPFWGMHNLPRLLLFRTASQGTLWTSVQIDQSLHSGSPRWQFCLQPSFLLQESKPLSLNDHCSQGRLQLFCHPQILFCSQTIGLAGLFPWLTLSPAVCGSFLLGTPGTS